MKNKGLFLLTLILLLLLAPMPLLALVQDAPVPVEPDPTNPWYYLALAANFGLVAFLVQILKNKLLPSLKEKAAYAIPLIAMVLGMAAPLVLQQTGIDILPIKDVFTAGLVSGAFASSGFVVAKEWGNKHRPAA
ncbi:MAG: hypothetical protein GY769_04365 [bacterium]|nr:hypothetical protein [bacterium]